MCRGESTVFLYEDATTNQIQNFTVLAPGVTKGNQVYLILPQLSGRDNSSDLEERTCFDPFVLEFYSGQGHIKSLS